MDSTVPANSPVRAAIFDLGNVIIDVDEKLAIDQWSAATGLPAERVAEAYWADTLYQRMEIGELSVEDYHRCVAGQLGTDLTFEAFLAGWNSVLLEPLPGAADLLAGLARSIRLVCLTNTNAAHADVWGPANAELLCCFERIFCSHEMGLRKPDPAIYQRVLDYLGVPAAEVVFIDDKPANVDAAAGLGIHGIVHVDIPQTAYALARLGVESL